MGPNRWTRCSNLSGWRALAHCDQLKDNCVATTPPEKRKLTNMMPVRDDRPRRGSPEICRPTPRTSAGGEPRFDDTVRLGRREVFVV